MIVRIVQRSRFLHPQSPSCNFHGPATSNAVVQKRRVAANAYQLGIRQKRAIGHLVQHRPSGRDLWATAAAGVRLGPSGGGSCGQRTCHLYLSSGPRLWTICTRGGLPDRTHMPAGNSCKLQFSRPGSQCLTPLCCIVAATQQIDMADVLTHQLHHSRVPALTLPKPDLAIPYLLQPDRSELDSSLGEWANVCGASIAPAGDDVGGKVIVHYTQDGTGESPLSIPHEPELKHGIIGKRSSWSARGIGRGFGVCDSGDGVRTEALCQRRISCDGCVKYISVDRPARAAVVAERKAQQRGGQESTLNCR